MLTQNVYSVGTAAVNVVEPTNSLVNYQLKNLQPKSVAEAARDGYIYLLNRDFTLTTGTPLTFSIVTGPTGCQFDFYDITSDTSNVFAELIEGATITVTGSPIPAYNLNRNSSDAHASVFRAVSAITGGTVVSSELITASKDAGGTLASGKIHTLEPNTQYAMRFTNRGNQDTGVHFQLGFSEQYNGYNNIWLETVNDSFVLIPGDEMTMKMLPGESINASALTDSCKLAVMRQE